MASSSNNFVLSLAPRSLVARWINICSLPAPCSIVPQPDWHANQANIFVTVFSQPHLAKLIYSALPKRLHDGHVHPAALVLRQTCRILRARSSDYTCVHLQVTQPRWAWFRDGFLGISAHPVWSLLTTMRMFSYPDYLEENLAVVAEGLPSVVTLCIQIAQRHHERQMYVQCDFPGLDHLRRLFSLETFGIVCKDAGVTLILDNVFSMTQWDMFDTRPLNILLNTTHHISLFRHRTVMKKAFGILRLQEHVAGTLLDSGCLATLRPRRVILLRHDEELPRQFHTSSLAPSRIVATLKVWSTSLETLVLHETDGSYEVACALKDLKSLVRLIWYPSDLRRDWQDLPVIQQRPSNAPDDFHGSGPDISMFHKRALLWLIRNVGPHLQRLELLRFGSAVPGSPRQTVPRSGWDCTEDFVELSIWELAHQWDGLVRGCVLGVGNPRTGDSGARVWPFKADNMAADVQPDLMTSVQFSHAEDTVTRYQPLLVYDTI